jgi:DNA-binding transcriptional LysR family regulator
MEMAQLEYFSKVVQERSFSKAADRVFRTQPAVSIAIRRLDFREQHPNVKVEIYRHVSSRLPREVLERNVDFALMASEPADRDLEAFPVLKDELVLIMSPKHPLAVRPSLRIKDLGKESFVAHNVKSGSRLKVIEAFARQHTPLNITLELATIETIKRFVQKRVGLAFVPKMCVREELERGVLATVPVRGLTHNRVLWAAHRRGSSFSPAAAAFLKILRKHTNGLGS